MYFLFMLGLMKHRRLRINMIYIKEYEVIVNWGKLSKACLLGFFLTSLYFGHKDASFLWLQGVHISHEERLFKENRVRVWMEGIRMTFLLQFPRLLSLKYSVCHIVPYFGVLDPDLWLPSQPIGKEPTCNAGDTVSIPGSGGSPGEGNDNPLQDSCLGNPMDRGAWRAIVHGVTKKSDMTQ